MVQFTDEFGARIWLVAQTIKYFKENVGYMAQNHKNANSVVENIYGDIFYLQDTCEEICERLFGKEGTQE